MTTETEKLLALLYQAGVQVEIKAGHLWITPPEIAQRFGDQIRSLKPQILIALGHCPECLRPLVVKDEESFSRRIEKHSYCPHPIEGKTWGHFDKWEA